MLYSSSSYLGTLSIESNIAGVIFYLNMFRSYHLYFDIYTRFFVLNFLVFTEFCKTTFEIVVFLKFSINILFVTMKNAGVTSNVGGLWQGSHRSF